MEMKEILRNAPLCGNGCQPYPRMVARDETQARELLRQVRSMANYYYNNLPDDGQAHGDIGYMLIEEVNGYVYAYYVDAYGNANIGAIIPAEIYRQIIT